MWEGYMKERYLDDYVKQYQERLKQQKIEKQARLEKKKFKLDEECIRAILDNQVMPYYKGMRYEIYKSKTTNSYYVKFWKENSYVTARVSDHESFVGAIGSTVDEETTKAEITAMFKNRIKALDWKRTCHLFDELKKNRPLQFTK